MANQIKGKYIKNGAIDGSKILLRNDQSLQALRADGTEEALFKLDSSNNLVLLKVPQVSADATGANDLVRKSQLDAETTARQTAVSELSTRIDNVLSNVDEVALNSLAEIVTAFQQADSDLDGAIITLAGAASANLNAEITARQAADQALQDAIDNLSPTLDGLSDVVISNKADEDLIQWDSTSGKWVNVAALSEASIVEVPGTPLSNAFLSWDFESAGSTATAGSTNNNYGNITGGVVMGSAAGPLGGYAATFDGTGYVVSSVPRYSQAPLTISLWFKSSSVGSVEQPLWTLQNQGANIAGGYAPQMRLMPDGSLYLYDYSSPNISGISSGLNDGNWHNVTLAVGPNGKKVYVDGSLAAEAVGATAIYSQENMYLMVGAGFGSNGYAGNFFTGSIDRVRYYLSELSPSEVSQEYAGTYDPGTTSVGGSSSIATGVIKTNAQGLLDDSFLSSAIARVSAVSAEQTARQAADDQLQSNIDSEAVTRESADNTLQSNIDVEASTRESADNTLQSNIDIESTARQSADAVIQSLLDSEVTARQAADQDLQDAIDAEVTARTTAVSDEASARESADNTLQSNIDAEMSARQAADADLQDAIDQEVSDRIDAVSTEVSDRQAADSALQSNIDAEMSARQAADATLQSNIDAEKSRIDAILLASDADKDSFAEIVSLINSVDTTNDQAFAGYVLSNDTALAQEVTSRQSADNTLQSNIDSEVTARQSADNTLQSNIDAEASSRQSADSTLQSNIDSEVTARQTADQTLQSNIDAEVTSRQAADQSLQDQIDALDSGSNAALAQEVSDRQAADSTLQSNLDAEVTARTSAVSAEQSARESADAALQAAIDDLDISELASVNITNAQDGDLWQFDVATGKWVNVAPLTEAGSTSSGSSGSPEVMHDYVATTWDAYGGRSTGIVFQAQSGDVVAKYTMPIGKGVDNWSGDGTITGKIYQVTSSFQQGNNFSISGQMTEVASSTNTHTYSSLPSSSTDPRSVPDLEFTFSDVALTAGNWYYIAAELPTTASGNYFSKAIAQFTPSISGKVINGSNVYGDNGFLVDGTVYSPGENTLVTTASVGVIKTNESGMLDDSFLGYDVDFGGHKLQGVSSPVSGTDAANKDYVDGAVSDEASARAAAVSSEASSRQSADSTLQSNIDAEVSARTAAVSGEASARQSADSTLQSNIDAEVTARQAADQSLQDQIDSLSTGSSSDLSAETTARQAADSALDVRVQAVEAIAVEFAKEKMTLTSTDISNGYVDLAHEIVSESLVGSVDRLMIHQTDDYTLSVVNGVTRVTFVGNLVDPSEEKLAVGDILRFTYAYLSISPGSGGSGGGSGSSGTPDLQGTSDNFSYGLFSTSPFEDLGSAYYSSVLIDDPLNVLAGSSGVTCYAVFNGTTYGPFTVVNTTSGSGLFRFAVDDGGSGDSSALAGAHEVGSITWQFFNPA